MAVCGHIDWPCCGCGDDLEYYDDGDLCSGCGEPGPHCVCDEDAADDSYDDSMDGDHEIALASAGWGVDEDYWPGACDDCGCDY